MGNQTSAPAKETPTKETPTTPSNSMKWTTTKMIVTVTLFALSGLCIFLGLKPMFDMTYDFKSFANLMFVAMNGFYIFSFSAVHRTSQFVFWSASFLLLITITLMFYNYDEIFLG